MMNGEIWWVDFGIPFGSEPGYKRPVIIMQSDEFNNSMIETRVVAPLTTNMILSEAPGNVLLKKSASKLPKDCVVNVSQLNVIDKERFVEKVSKVPKSVMKEIQSGILLLFGM